MPRGLTGYTLITPALVASLALVIGGLISHQPEIAVLALCVFVALPAVAMPSAYWVVAAVTAALTLKGISTLGVLPSIATYLDIPLAWGAFLVALLHARVLTREARAFVILLTSLLAISCVSAAFAHSELMRPLFFFALLAQPFAIAGALIIDPPSPRQRVVLERTLILLLAVQIPLAYLELALYGAAGDYIKGSLWGAGAGHHVISGVIALGCIWLLVTPNLVSKPTQILLLLLLVPIPFIADAKQVILALPAVLLVARWNSVKDLLARGTSVAVAVLVLILAFPAGQIALSFIDEMRHGNTSKQRTAAFVLGKMNRDPASLVFGLGPAETVSRAAFMTTGGFLSTDSPIRTLGLAPAQVTTEAQMAGVLKLSGVTGTASTGGNVSSFESGLSSAVGVLGDIGILGLASYLSLWWLLFSRVRRSPKSEATAAAAAIPLLFVLGFVFDWWEQPPFTVFIGCLVGLAATSGRDSSAADHRNYARAR